VNQVTLAIGFGLVTASIIALGAVGFTLQFAITNIFNLAYGSIMTVAAYSAYAVSVRGGVSIWLGLLGGAICGAIVSVAINRLIYLPFLRRGTSQFAMVMVTLAVSTITVNVVQILAGTDNYGYNVVYGSNFRFAGMILTARQLAIIGIAAGSMLALHLLLRYTRAGKAMRATASDAALARSCGIATGRVTDLAWLLSGLLCGAAGVTLGMNTVVFDSTAGSTFLLVIVAAAVFGSAGAIYGAMLGSLVVGIGSELAAIVDPALKDVAAFSVIVLVLLIRPESVLGRSSGGSADTGTA
jgi:branched-subunit amino acid ABC-type transport system permease component